MSAHPVLLREATLADLQTYIARTNIYRRHKTDAQSCLLLLCEEVGELAKAVRKSAGIATDIEKADDAHADEEAADVLWVLVSLCNSLNIDIEQAFRAKDEKNKTRVWK